MDIAVVDDSGDDTEQEEEFPSKERGECGAGGGGVGGRLVLASRSIHSEPLWSLGLLLLLWWWWEEGLE